MVYQLRRSVSGLTTLTMLNKKSAKLKQFIGLITVFLIITSTIVMFTAISLIWWYMMPHLKFWHDLFIQAPYLMLGVGIYTFVVSLFGFCVSTSGNRVLLITLAVFLSIACVAQIVSIFLFWNVKSVIENPNIGETRGNSEMTRYYGKEGYENVTSSWDKMQQHLHCCGVNHYKDWQDWSENIGNPVDDLGVPDSCCIETKDGCGKKMISEKDLSKIMKHIYVFGCFQLLKNWMERDIEPVIEVYSGVGVVTAIIELIATALVSVYCAQIKRKRTKAEQQRIDKHFQTSPGINSHGEILLETEYNPRPEYESSKNESEI